MAGPNPVVEDGGYHFSFKVAICGDTGVGKTTLLEGEGASSYARTSGDTTVGINFRVKFYEVDGQTYRVQFWDCPGAERYMKLTSRYCAGAAGGAAAIEGEGWPHSGAQPDGLNWPFDKSSTP